MTENASEEPREVVVRISREFEYRGARFEGGKFYRVRDEPANFIDFHIVKNKTGARLEQDEVPKDAEVLDDPRPAARKASDQRKQEEADAIRQHQEASQTSEAARAQKQQEANEGNRASTFTSSQNIVENVNTPEGGSRPAQPGEFGQPPEGSPAQPAGQDQPQGQTPPESGPSGDDQGSGGEVARSVATRALGR